MRRRKTPACACQCGATTEADVFEVVKEVGSTADGTLSIKVLGEGCTSCHSLLEHTKEAVANIGLSAAVEYVDDMGAIAGYGVMSIPALVINEKVVTTGKVLKTSEVENLLRKIGT